MIQSVKKFIITIDTEGDGLWDWKQGDRITTENAKYLSRFQSLCNEFGFKPVWITNYEMINDPTYVDFIAEVERDKLGELGMHLHAWNNPPEYDIKTVQNGAPYLIEYPVEIMEAKIAVLTECIKKRTGITPISHRAGRWAMNDEYFRLLIKYGYKVDCSVTPHIDWGSSAGASLCARGSDYSNAAEEPYRVDDANGYPTLLEVPVTIRRTHCPIPPDRITPKNLLRSVYHAIKGNTLWLRPNGRNYKSMIKLADIIRKSGSDYIMFMLHSSELMPGGSPTFKTAESIEDLYMTLSKLFSYCARYFAGATLRDYFMEKKANGSN